MLTINLPNVELFDEQTLKFVEKKAVTFDIEHSLVSLAAWESKWEVPFLGEETKTTEQTIDYVRCMTLTPNISSDVYEHLPNSVLKQVNDYIVLKMTATWFLQTSRGFVKKSVITAEIIYYWMISLEIPFECQYWHLNRLLTLIQVCNEKNAPPKKTAPGDLLAQRKALNEKRKAEHKTTG